MSTIMPIAPFQVRDGTLPVAPKFSLVQTLAATGQDVTTTENDERWIGGVRIDPQLCTPPETVGYDCFSVDDVKDEGDYGAVTEWKGFTIYAPIKCGTLGAARGERLQQRAAAYLNAADSYAFERVLEQGVSDNPFLGDGNVNDVTSATAVDLVTAWGLLEDAAAAPGRGGAVFHIPSRVAAVALHFNLAYKDGSILRSSSSDYPVAVGQGYAGALEGSGSLDAGTRYIYVSGPLQLRRGPVEMLTDDPGEALDRETNTYVFRAERPGLILFDPCVQAAALVDLSLTDTDSNIFP